MNIEYYAGIQGDAIEIEQPTDIYALLDWCQSKMIEKQEDTKAEINKKKWQKGIDFCSKLMQEAHKEGFGSPEDLF